MVYIRNIIALHTKMQKDQQITLYYGAGLENRIFKEDILEKQNGDLKILRIVDKEVLCEIIIDCEEVKTAILSKKW